MRRAALSCFRSSAIAVAIGFLLSAVPAAPSPAPAPAPDSPEARLLEAALASDVAWDRLVHLSDRIGHRLSGSSNLARAVDWAAECFELDGLENVRRQRVMVPHWVRGRERAEMTAPRRLPLAMLGLGRSPGTPSGGVHASVVVAESFEQFDAMPDDRVHGKIILWNVPFTTYGETVKYRWKGPATAAARGAVAALVRSVAPSSLQSPHTGAMAPWEEEAPRIPAAALSIEDAEMLARIVGAGDDVRVRLQMGARTLDDAESHNVFGEIRGRELADEIVVIGGHLDSWDVGQGAQDDGGGCVVAMEAARLIAELGVRPRRTVRVVLWTNEENGGRGAEAYREESRAEGENHVAAIESDGGVESPWGFGVSVWRVGTRVSDGPAEQRAVEVLREIAVPLARVAADSIRIGGGGADIAPLMEEGALGLALRTPMAAYWDIHHSAADTVEKVDPLALRRNVAAMAVMAWALADRAEPLR